MTTSQSPIKVLRAQAAGISRALKAVECGETSDPAYAKLASARQKPMVRFAVAMDDKTLTIEFTWESVRDTSEPALTEWILAHMRGEKPT